MRKLLLAVLLLSLVFIPSSYSKPRQKKSSSRASQRTSKPQKDFGVVKPKDHDGLAGTPKQLFQINLAALKPKGSDTWMGDEKRIYSFAISKPYLIELQFVGGLYVGHQWTLKKGGRVIANGSAGKKARNKRKINLQPGRYTLHCIAVEKVKSTRITWCNAGSIVAVSLSSKDTESKSVKKGKKGKKGKSKSSKESTKTSKSKPRYVPPPPPPSVDVRTDPSGIIEANAGDVVEVMVTVRNNGSRRLTGLRMDIDGMEKINPRKTTLSPGEWFSQKVNMPPVGRGMCGFHIFVYSNEGLRKFTPVIINGKFEPFPPFLKKLDSASVHKLLPDEVYYAKLTEQFEQLDGRIASRRYGTKATNNSILIHLNYHNFNEDLTPKRWQKVLDEKKSQIGGTIKKVKDYPVVIEKDVPALLTGYFCFGRYTVTINCLAHYATMSYFDDAVETILKKMGYLEYLEESRKKPRLDIVDYDPERLTISKSSEIEFTIKIENEGDKQAQNAAISLIDSDNQTIGFTKVGDLGPDQAKQVKFKANIKADKQHKSRKLLLKFSASNTDREDTEKIKVETKMPPKLSLKPTSPVLVVDAKNEVEGFGLILTNEGDESAELIAGLELVDQDCALEGERIDIDGNDTDTIETQGMAAFALIIKYFIENHQLPQEGQIRYYLKEGKNAPVIAETQVDFKYAKNFKSDIVVKLDKKEVSYDFTPRGGDEEEWEEEDWEEEEEEEEEREEEEWEESESFELPGEPMPKDFYLASPFGIRVSNQGGMPAKNLEVIITSYTSGAIVSCDVKVLGPANGYWRWQEDFKIKEFPIYKDFAKLITAENGKNKLAIVILEDDEEVFREDLVLNIKGLKPKVEDMGVLAQLIAIQKEQKEFFKNFLLHHRELGEFQIYLYAKGSKTDIKYEGTGSSGWDNINRQIKLYAGDAVGEKALDEVERLKYDLAHELVHLISFDIIKQHNGYIDRQGKPRKIPIWFVEGLAECAAMQWHKQHLNIANSLYTTDYISKLKAYVQQGNSPFDILHLAMEREGWSLEPLEYAAAATFVEHIYRIHGPEILISIWIDAGKDGDVESAIKRHTGKSVTEWKRTWRRYLMSEYEFK